MSASSVAASSAGETWANRLRRLGEMSQVRIVLACGIVCAGLGIAWSYLFPGNWTASQSLVVRDDLLGESFKPGRFNSPESLKSAQETILHIARKPDVIRAALAATGYPADRLDAATLEQWQGRISVIAPNGAEFGKTEVVVLKVRDQSASRASRMATALTAEIEVQLRDYRTRLLSSLNRELQSGLTRASAQYEELAAQVARLEQSVGPDVTTLRAMVESNAGGSDLRQSLETVRAEIRSCSSDLERAEKQRELVRAAAAADQPDAIATSSELLDLQPVLRRLLDGLTDARLALTNALGKYDDGHPSVNNARTAVERTSQAIREQLLASSTGLDSQISLFRQKLERLRQSESWYSDRLVELGRIRVEYKGLVEELTKRNEVLARSRADLARIQSLGEFTDQVNLITLIGGPQIGSRRDGLSRRALALLGLFGGFAFGLGWLAWGNGTPPTLSGLFRPQAGDANSSAGPRPDRDATPAAQPRGNPSEQSVRRPVTRPYGSSKVANDGVPGQRNPTNRRAARPHEPAKEAERAAQSTDPPAQVEPVSPVASAPASVPANPPVSGEAADNPEPSRASVMAAIADANQSAAAYLDPAIPPLAPNATVPVADALPEPAAPSAVPAPAPVVEPPVASASDTAIAAAIAEQSAVSAYPSVPPPPDPPTTPAVPVRDVLAEAGSRSTRSPFNTALDLPAGVRPGMMVESDTGRRPGYVPIGKRRSGSPQSADATPAVRIADAPAPPQATRTDPEGRERNQTVSLEQMRIDEIRRQILELDPTIQLDVFCEPLRKDPPAAT